MQTRSSGSRGSSRPNTFARRGQGALAYIVNAWKSTVASVAGLPPEKAALSLAVGLVLGIFPVFGTTTVLGGAVGGLLRTHVHVATLLAGVLVATPIEVALIPPFLRLGSFLIGMPPVPLAPAHLWQARSKKMTLREELHIITSVSADPS